MAKEQDIEKHDKKVIIIKALIDLGYRGDNIFEGILRLE